MEIKLKTLTPLWTGGVDQRCNRIHETGLIGSLRWWYEALVRGLGGYACDPTSENAEARCAFNSKAYEEVKADERKDEEAIQAGLKTLCPVCYLFGASGWARLFHLRATEVPTTLLHFRTTLQMNQGWLRRIFGGENASIDTLRVPYGDLRFQFITRRHDREYAKSQFALALRVAAEYGGIGARLQHGFGQVIFPRELDDTSIPYGISQLVSRIEYCALRSEGPAIHTPFDLRDFVSLTYHIDKNRLRIFEQGKTHIGNEQKQKELDYLPCALDLRYKGSGEWGMRQWLKRKGWKESNDPTKLEELDFLLGPRSQWGPKGREQRIEEDLRTASRVFFSMPRRMDTHTYVLRIWAFLPPDLEHRFTAVPDLKDLCGEYIQSVLGVQPISVTFGEQIMQQERGGQDGLGLPCGN